MRLMRLMRASVSLVAQGDMLLTANRKLLTANP